MQTAFIRSLFVPAFYAAPLLAAPTPTDPDAVVPSVEYQSAFPTYRSYVDEPVADWRAINDEVTRVGGHGGVVGGRSGHAGHEQSKSTQPTVEAPPGHVQPPARGAPKASAEHQHGAKP